MYIYIYIYMYSYWYYRCVRTCAVAQDLCAGMLVLGLGSSCKEAPSLPFKSEAWVVKVFQLGFYACRQTQDGLGDRNSPK